MQLIRPTVLKQRENSMVLFELNGNYNGVF